MLTLRSHKSKFVFSLVVIASLCLLLLLSSARLSAQDYSCGAYGSGAYQSSEACLEGDQQESDLENTGQPVMLGLIAGGTLLAIGVVGLVSSYRKGKSKK